MHDIGMGILILMLLCVTVALFVDQNKKGP